MNIRCANCNEELVSGENVKYNQPYLCKCGTTTIHSKPYNPFDLLYERRKQGIEPGRTNPDVEIV